MVSPALSLLPLSPEEKSSLMKAWRKVRVLESWTGVEEEEEDEEEELDEEAGVDEETGVEKLKPPLQAWICNSLRIFPQCDTTPAEVSRHAIGLSC